MTPFYPLILRCIRSNRCASVCKQLQAPACASVQPRHLPLFTYASKSLHAYAAEGVTCQINSGAKHVVAVSKPYDGISNRNISVVVFARSLDLSTLTQQRIAFVNCYPRYSPVVVQKHQPMSTYYEVHCGPSGSGYWRSSVVPWRLFPASR